MQKISTRFFTSLFAITIAGIFFSLQLFTACNHPDNHIKNSIEETDGMELAIKQEFELTKDPALNYVPVNRILAAKNEKEAKLSALRPNTAVTGINWQERGPNNVGGRTRAVWFDLGDAGNGYKKVWAAGVGGGLWFTNDITAGSPSWNKINDFFDNIAITTFIQNPANPQEMYFGTGEGWFNLDAIEGLGIWKSANGGTSWSRLLSTSNFAYVQDLLIDQNSNLYASVRQRTGSHAAGIQKSTDGGATWTQVLGSPVFGSSNRGADLELAANGDIYASLGTTGSNGGIYKSTVAANGANVGNTGTWVNITPNTTGTITAPTNFWHRIELACALSDANTMYALFQGNGSNNCTSIQQYNAGTNTWTVRTVPTIIDQGNNSNFTRGQAWYDLIASVDPNNANRLYIGGIDALRSDDGAATWTQMTTWSLFAATGFNANQLVHADHHAITYAPGSSSRALWGTDGGIYYTANADITGAGNKPAYTSKNTGYNITQYYSCAIHPATTNYFLAGAQDNGTQRFTSAGINNTNNVSGGDGAFCHIDQDNPNIQISSYTNNNYYVSTNGGTSFTSSSKNDDGSFINPTDYDDAGNILYAGNYAGTYFRWTDPATNGADDTVTVAAFGIATITHVSVSPLTANRVYFGLNNGSVILVNNANTGTAIAGTTIKTGSGSVSCIAIDPANEDHILVTYSNYGVTSIFESANATQASPTWTPVEGNLPDMPVRWAMFDPRNTDWALIATELGVWSTDNLNGGATDWQPTNSGLANVRVDMLQYRISDRTIAAATHGRGLFTATVPASTTPDVSFAAGTAAATELTTSTTANCRNYTDYTVNMQIANPPTGDATITINVSAGTAVRGIDYDFTTNNNFAAPSNSFIFLSGSTALHPVNIRIYNDAEIEVAENFTLSYIISGATNAQAGTFNQTYNFTINSEDAAPASSFSNTYSIGGTSFSLGDATAGQPFDAKLQSKKTAMLYKASELTAAGATAGNITSIAFNMQKNSIRPYQNFEIKIGSTLVPYLVDGGVTVLGTATYKSIASFNTINGWNTFILDAPYNWDGTSNLVFEICYDNGAANAADAADVTYGYSDGGTGTQGNMYWQDGINCGTAFSSVIYYSSGIKPQIQIGSSSAGTTVASVLNTSKTEYMSGFSDLYFYSGTGEVLARVRNLSVHNYGCAQVIIDRAGTAGTQFWNSNTANYLMNKTFRVIPTTNNSSGQYEITLFFTQAEVLGWETATGQIWGNIKLIKVPGQISNVTPTTPEPDGVGTVSVVTPTLGTLGTNYTLTYTFTNGFSGFGAGIPGINTLPVTLLSFTGQLKGKYSELNWSTSGEINSRGFEIQKSADGTNFKKIGFVPSAGNSSAKKEYSFTDKEQAAAINYYRLNMVDIDNKSKLSEVVIIKNPDVKQQLHIINNPFDTYIDTRFEKIPEGKINMQLFDLLGKKIAETELNNINNSTIRFNLTGNNLSSGVYIMKVQAEKKVYTRKVVKQ